MKENPRRFVKSKKKEEYLGRNSSTFFNRKFPLKKNEASKMEYLRCILVSEVVLIKDPPGDISVSTWQAMALGRAFEIEGKNVPNLTSKFDTKKK